MSEETNDSTATHFSIPNGRLFVPSYPPYKYCRTSVVLRSCPTMLIFRILILYYWHIYGNKIVIMDGWITRYAHKHWHTIANVSLQLCGQWKQFTILNGDWLAQDFAIFSPVLFHISAVVMCTSGNLCPVIFSILLRPTTIDYGRTIY